MVIVPSPPFWCKLKTVYLLHCTLKIYKSFKCEYIVFNIQGIMWKPPIFGWNLKKYQILYIYFKRGIKNFGVNCSVLVAQAMVFQAREWLHSFQSRLMRLEKYILSFHHHFDKEVFYCLTPTELSLFLAARFKLSVTFTVKIKI